MKLFVFMGGTGLSSLLNLFVTTPSLSRHGAWLWVVCKIGEAYIHKCYPLAFVEVAEDFNPYPVVQELGHKSRCSAVFMHPFPYFTNGMV